MSAGWMNLLFRDRAPGLLVAFSIVLLLVLQLAWLRSAWKEEQESLRKETNSLFRTTIFSMHDSLILRNIETIQVDSAFHGGPLPSDVVNRTRNRLDASDDSHGRTQTSAFVDVFIAPDSKDSVRRIFKPLIRRMRADASHRRFLVRFGADSLHRDSIAHEFSEALAKAGINLPFQIHRIQRQTPGLRVPVIELRERSFLSEPVPFNPANHYVASFSGTNGYFLKAIMPEILFSLFVTLLTSGSFWLMRRSIRAQKNLVKMKGDFISNITHELKTPVATVSVALEAMERFEALDDKQKTKEYIGMAQDELNRLLIMIDKVLQTASFENDVHVMNPEKIDLDDDVRSVLRSMKLVFEKRQLQVRYASKGTDFTIHGSRAPLVTALYNLLDNAIKYSPVSSAILITLNASEKNISLSVEDNGIGIPQEYQKRIFDRFFRVPSGDVHNVKGYGLGLNYVAHVVEGHHGTIHVESSEGKGSSFTIHLPKNVDM